MTVEIEFIESMELFHELDITGLVKIASLMTPIKVREGEVLTQRGEPALKFYILMKGNFIIQFAQGRAYTIHEPGSIMGWSTLMTPVIYKGTAVALTDSRVLEIPGSELLELICSDSLISEKIMKRVNKVIEERMRFLDEGGK